MARSIDRRNCRVADRVQCDSQYTLDTLQQKYPRQIGDKGCVAPGWVDYARFASAGSREQARHSLGPTWESEVPVLFTLRRLEARMGLDTLIEAAALVRDRGHNFRVLIGGSGSLRESLTGLIRERRLTDRISLLGRVPEADLPACYAAADCFVLPTRALECFGLIVLEAFAAGTPVIASNAAAIP
jgi:glycosyltransferase involved in cell wall biosynthesis